jgi:hypothetical protein
MRKKSTKQNKFSFSRLTGNLHILLAEKRQNPGKWKLVVTVGETTRKIQ